MMDPASCMALCCSAFSGKLSYVSVRNQLFFRGEEINLTWSKSKNS